MDAVEADTGQSAGCPFKRKIQQNFIEKKSFMLLKLDELALGSTVIELFAKRSLKARVRNVPA
jgi:hypothetical protein